MIKGSCPTCRKQFAIATLGDLPSFPFCTERCRLIDLGRWIDGVHAIPGVTNSAPDSTNPPDPDEIDD